VAGLTRQALIVSASRFINQGLMVISPVILVRLLTVQDFGEYREFLMYATVVGNLAAFSLANSLLYFVGLQPAGAWGYVRRIVISLAITSIAACIGFIVVDRLAPVPLIGDALWPCVLYILFYTNVDFWEFLWVAQKRPTAVFAYTAGRLVLRIVVVITAAWFTRDVTVILWALVALEGLRLLVSMWFWRRLAAQGPSEPLRVGWREQLEFCVPSGIAVFVTTLNSSLGGMFIDQTLGEAQLAQFVIAGYVIMVVYPLRNSISDVLLPEMAALASRAHNGWLALWQRSVVLFAILLLPAAVLLARYAEPFVVTAFSDKYRDAVPVFQLHCLLLALSCFDVALVLRAVNKTRALLTANFICVAVNLGAMYWMVPAWGASGAVLALVLSSVVGLWYLLRLVARMHGLTVSELLPVRRLGLVVAASLVAALVTVPAAWTEQLGIAGVLLASMLYCVAFAALLLRVFRVEEADWLLGMITSRLRLRRAEA